MGLFAVSAIKGRPTVLAVVVAFAVGACSPSGASPDPATLSPTVSAVALFTIDHPAQGATVTTSPVEVGGTAAAGALIVQDVSFASDLEAIAGPDGRWAILVALKEGANDLVFRLGADSSTEKHLGLTYAPAAAATPIVTTPPQSTSAPAPTSPPPTPVITEPPPTPEITPKPEPTFRTYGDGIFEVGVDIKPGTYRLREPAGFCYWARLRGFDGSLGDIIANDNVVDAYSVVTIKASDAGFESSGCDEWSSDLSRVTDSKSSIDWDGTYIVGTDITAGKWKSTGGDFCYWARLNAFTGTIGAIIANGLPDGPTIVTIRSTDKGFEATGCGTWTRQ